MDKTAQIIAELKSNSLIEIIEYSLSPAYTQAEMGEILSEAKFKLPDSVLAFYREFSSLRIEWQIKPDALKDIPPSVLPDRHSIYSIRGNIDILDPYTIVHDFIGENWNYPQISSASERVSEMTRNAFFRPFDFASGGDLHIGFSSDGSEKLLINDQYYDALVPLSIKPSDYFNLLYKTMGFWQWPLLFSAEESPETITIRHYLKHLFGKTI